MKIWHVFKPEDKFSDNDILSKKLLDCDVIYQGAFSEKSKAIEACKTNRHYAFEWDLDKEFPEEPTDIPEGTDIYCPMLGYI